MIARLAGSSVAISKSEPALELHSRAVSSHRSSGPNQSPKTGSNSGGSRIKNIIYYQAKPLLRHSCWDRRWRWGQSRATNSKCPSVLTVCGSPENKTSVMRPLCLVKSRSQDTATNAGVLSFYLLYPHHQLFIDIERKYNLCPFTVFHC